MAPESVTDIVGGTENDSPFFVHFCAITVRLGG